MLTTSTKKYNGIACPYDGKAMDQIDHPVDGGPHLVFWEVVCPKCHRHFTENYTLTELVEDDKQIRFEIE